MRDFRDAKPMAQTVRAALAAKGLKITISESLELIAKAFGVADWNTLSAAIKAAEAEPNRSQASADQTLDGLARTLGLENWNKLKAMIELEARASGPRAPRRSEPAADAPQTPEPPDTIPKPAGRVIFSAVLEATLHRAVGLAIARKHELTTLEHLLLALIDDLDAAEVMRACEVDIEELRKTLASFVDNDLRSAGLSDGEDPAPTSGFQRVIQRAVIHVQTSGRDNVTGANVLVAIFSERESHAAYLLQQQGMTRYDAVSFITHGVRKDGGRAA